MFIYLASLAVLALAQDSTEKLNIKEFEREDKNRDNILTHDQFISALGRAFRSIVIFTQGLGTSNEIVNNFGREFLGEKESDGKVDLNNIRNWIETGEILQEFEEWKIINEEGELHNKKKHSHFKMPHFGGRGMSRPRVKKDL